MERACWRQHEQLYKEKMLGVCLRMRWAPAVWVRAHVDRVCKQFWMETAVDLSCAFKACIKTESDDSVVYVCVNLLYFHFEPVY